MNKVNTSIIGIKNKMQVTLKNVPHADTLKHSSAHAFEQCVMVHADGFALAGPLPRSAAASRRIYCTLFSIKR